MKKRYQMLIPVVLGISAAAVFLQNPAVDENPARNPLVLSLNQEKSLENDWLEGITAKQVYLQERSGAAVYQKESNRKVSIASLTKIMTTLCLIEHQQNFSEVVEIPAGIFPFIEKEQLATAGFLEGERVPFEELLYAIMLPSGAEAALSGAIHLSGTEKRFVALMNDKAAELGLTGTHFNNVTGVDEGNHYSTAADTASLLDYALDNPVFYEIFTTFEYQTSGTALHPEGVYLSSTLLKSGEPLDWETGRIQGGKTGFTYDAGQCLASLAEIDGKEYLLVLIGASGSGDSEQRNIKESRLLYQRLDSLDLDSAQL
ncbi:D-alanyl-D-alanine carboxypeptidase family protein [Enterococcus sp. LJL51]|uniref:D-alanyl-D-alanine carboxypeptidase family protein n=1 Tax=Enterococcus sp. LJL51 TaxID=3416656 RepID=UPI003CEA5805